MQYSHNEEQVEKFSSQALEKIASLNLPMMPNVYEVWYVNFSGENPELSHAIEVLEIEKKTVSALDVDDLYKKYLDNEENAAQVREAGSRIQTTIKDVNALVSDVKEVTTQYSQNLSGVTQKLNEDCSPDEMKSLLKTIVTDTETILEKNQRLESELEKQAQMVLSLQRDFDRVSQEAMTDGLTNVANRKAFDKYFDEMLTQLEAEDHTKTFSLILVDIDHFKAFNDDYGHQVGDQVLRLVAKTLTEGVKGRDFVARYGGEEFAIMLPGTNQHAAERVANDVREAVASKQIVNRNNGKKLGRITLSGGVTEFFVGDNKADMIERADEALYQAKDKGRNQICVAKISVVRSSQG